MSKREREREGGRERGRGRKKELYNCPDSKGYPLISMDICFILCHASICTCLDLGSWSEKTTIFELGCTVSKIPNVAINWRIIVNKSNLLLWSIVLYGVISRKCIVIRLARALFLRHTAVYTIVCPQLRLPELYIRRCLCVCHSMCMCVCTWWILH